MSYNYSTDLYEKDDRNPGTFIVNGSLDPASSEYDLGGELRWRNMTVNTVVTNNIYASNVEQIINFSGASLTSINNLNIEGSIYQGGNQITLTGDGVQITASGSSKWSNVDTNLFVIGSNVGIGTNAPLQALDVVGTVQATSFVGDGSLLTGINTSRWSNVGTDLFVTGSNVGIGTNAPLQALDVVGTVQATSFVGDGSLLTGINTSRWSNVGTDLFVTGSNVGIGTNAPLEKLHVQGSIVASGTVTGTSFIGNASTATILQTARTINGQPFDGSANITIATLSTLSRGTYLTGADFNGITATTWAVDATNLNTPSKIVVRDASGNFSAGIVSADLSGNATTATTLKTARNINGTAFNGSADITVTANTSSTLTRGTYLTGGDFNGGTATTWAVDATDVNTPSKIVARDASGNFSAGIVTAALTGNATSATTLQTARTINGSAFNGSANITVTANTPTTLTRGTFLTGADFNGGTATTWAVDATDVNTPSKIVARDASGNFSAGTVTAALAGNATTATTLQTARTINGTSFNGSANITVTANTPTTLTRGTYLTGADFNGGTGTTWAVDATNLNTAGKIVARDVSGNFSAGTVTAALAGNATTATTLQTARTINGTSFNGSANITVTANTTNALTIGSYLTGTSFNGSAATTIAVDATTAETASKIVARDASGDTFARLYRSIYTNEATIGGAMAFRTNNTTDNYIRFCNDTAAIRTFLDAPSRTGGGASGTWNINISGTAAGASSQWTTAGTSIYYNAGNVGIGTTAPTAALEVRGTVTAQVFNNSWMPPVKKMFAAPTYLDVSTGNTGAKGFAGGFTDGRYAYLVPNYNTNLHGIFTRIEINNFTTSGVTYLKVDIANTNAVYFLGGFTDGRYAYLVPSSNATAACTFTRVDLTLANFSSPVAATANGVTHLNVTANNAGAQGFAGGFMNGIYAYLVPYSNSVASYFGPLTRVDLNNFTTSGVSYLYLNTGNTNAGGFFGGFTDGRYGYLVPNRNNTSGIFTRVDLNNFTTSGVSYLDVAAAGNTLAKGFRGGFTDGRYGYLVPLVNGSYNGIVARVDLAKFDASGVTYLDVSTGGNTLAKGFQGGFTDGRYAYLTPANNGSPHGIFTRIDVNNFTASGVSYLDVSIGNINAKSMIGAFTDGRYAYLPPPTGGGIFTRVLIGDVYPQGI